MLVLSFDIGIKNLAYCLLDITKTSTTILDWNIIDCSVGTKTFASSDVIKKIITTLNELDYLLDAELILIEKQPSCNPKMRIINSCIYMYFMIKTIDNNISKCKIINYSPKHKLKCCDIKIPKTVKSNYSQNKKLAIEHARYFIKDTSWLNFFNKTSKKDDLADCFLQAKSYFL